MSSLIARTLARDAPVRIGIVAGESSGDLLGADLIIHLRALFPDAQFEGLGGDKMRAAGFKSLFDMERVAVMGLIEPLKRLPELFRIRRELFRHFVNWGADLVVGIDSPDFNLGLELKLRRHGLLTAHYVSPSVWAWRQGRVKKIAKAVDHMLTLFPFEHDFYTAHQVPVSYVGHPLADTIPLELDAQQYRQKLGLPGDGLVLAVMPGSRGSEVRQMCDLYLQACRRLQADNPRLHFVLPAANPNRYREIREILTAYPDLDVTLLEGQSQEAMAASHAVLLTSGTTALEAMLLNKPMVVAYRMGNIPYRLLSRLIKTPYISLPNLIAGKPLVSELVQDHATVDNLVTETGSVLYDREKRASLKREFARMHRDLQRNAGATAAGILADMITSRERKS